MADPLEVAARLEVLPVRIDRVSAEEGFAALPDYPENGGRPTGVVRVEGAGRVGSGECVAWTAAEQARFAFACAGALPAGGGTVGAVARRLASAGLGRYVRAALEAAVVDLALRQAGSSLFDLAGARPRPVAFVLSFAAPADPARALAGVLAAVPGARMKLDVDPRWPAGAFESLSPLAGAIAVLDLKLRGDLALAERAHAALPAALLEDPRLDPRPVARAGEGVVDAEAAYAAGETPASLVGVRAVALAAPSLRARVGVDGPVLGASDVDALPFAPAAVNVKVARIGGLLETLRTIAACRRARIRTYVGGMFEVGPGRAQAQALASLFSPDAPNDVAPLRTRSGDRPASSPLPVPSAFTGLGFP